MFSNVIGNLQLRDLEKSKLSAIIRNIETTHISALEPEKLLSISSKMPDSDLAGLEEEKRTSILLSLGVDYIRFDADGNPVTGIDKGSSPGFAETSDSRTRDQSDIIWVNLIKGFGIAIFPDS
jgi:hypothetical protein